MRKERKKENTATLFQHFSYFLFHLPSLLDQKKRLFQVAVILSNWIRQVLLYFIIIIVFVINIISIIITIHPFLSIIVELTPTIQMTWKNLALGVCDKNTLVWENMAMCWDDTNLLSWAFQLKAGVTEKRHYECTNLLEGD